ncbi:MAG TPA: ATP-binding protein, partial [Phnomibacter sp.]|nr:ATP-binding protein [Phnomibacter sp.]
AAIEWAEPEKLSFYYRLQDQQAAQWQPLPTNPTLQLIGYSPGTYQLEFKAHNSYGLASDIKALTLTIQPPWHQTWWFKVAVLLVLLGAGYLLYRYRLSQVLARERMRQRIAADLHDDIGSTLASVHMYTNLALQRQQSQYLHLIKEGVLDAYQSTRDMIWMMKSEYNSLGALAAQVRKFATPVSQATGMHWQMHLPALLEDYRLSFDQRRHLYMMLKEFVNNSAKYSQANTLKFVVEAEQNGVMLSMADDGCGFVPDDKQNGNGLKNMERRAAEIGARFQLFSQPGKGTCMVIHLARLPGAGHKPKKPYVG